MTRFWLMVPTRLSMIEFRARTLLDTRFSNQPCHAALAIPALLDTTNKMISNPEQEIKLLLELSPQCKDQDVPSDHER